MMKYTFRQLYDQIGRSQFQELIRQIGLRKFTSYFHPKKVAYYLKECTYSRK